MMADEAQRLQLFKDANKKNSSLVERLISWPKNIADKFVDFMFKPAIVDAHGNKKYRYNRETHALEHADGTPLETLPETKANEKSGDGESRDGGGEIFP